jgi:hypothetical protein
VFDLMIFFHFSRETLNVFKIKLYLSRARIDMCAPSPIPNKIRFPFYSLFSRILYLKPRDQLVLSYSNFNRKLFRLTHYEKKAKNFFLTTYTILTHTHTHCVSLSFSSYLLFFFFFSPFLNVIRIYIL